MDQLLTTKLYAPPLRPGLVRRPRLVQKLNLGLRTGSQLTLISASAGYGKTTLALEWLASLDRPYGWLSLDRGDNHPVQFLTYLLAALRQVDEKIGQAVQLGEAAERPDDSAAWLESHLTTLINHIAAVAAPFVLVLDDYHAITNLAIHQALGFLLDHQPTQMHLVIITRQDPLLPLPRLRSRRLVTEVRLGDLRFTQEEAAVFLNDMMGLELIPAEIALLEARTEGWIAGLQLAALSLSEITATSPDSLDPAPRSEFIRAFTGDDRHVLDYLMDEVLSRQPETVQRFLLWTSILKRLCGPLCDAVLEIRNQELGIRDSGVEFKLGELSSADSLIPDSLIPNSQSLLEYLERSNLFIIPLDNRRQWYRYHHLFADLLSSRLQSSDPDLVATLHCQASQWYASAGFAADAVDHALLAEDFDQALRLIEHAARTSIWASGDLPVLVNWSKRLPEEVLITRPRLCLYCARGLFFAGEVDAAERYLQAAEQALLARTRTDGQTDELWGVLFTNRATFAAMRGDSQAALELTRQAQARVSAEDLSTHARIAHAVGMAEHLLGDVRRAEQAFSQTVQLAHQANNRILWLDAVSCLALTLIQSGRLRRAVQVCQEVLAQDTDTRLVPAASAVYLALGQALYEQNELPEARDTLTMGIELGRKARWPHVLWQAYAIQAQVMQASGKSEGAHEALDQAEQVARRYHIPLVSRLASAYRARVELVLGEMELAVRWADTYQGLPPGEGLRDFEDLTLARVRLAQGRPSDALGILDGLLLMADSAGRQRTVIEAQTLRSLTCMKQGKRAEAIETLSGALAQAAPEAFVQIFLQEGQPMAELLRLVRQSRVGGSAASYAARLLAAIERRDFQPPAVPPADLPSSPLIEPLGERELEVLCLIAEGLSNPEIAARLYLSTNTVRVHTYNIYQKLDVHNRVQAVARARELGLLPG